VLDATAQKKGGNPGEASSASSFYQRQKERKKVTSSIEMEPRNKEDARCIEKKEGKYCIVDFSTRERRGIRGGIRGEKGRLFHLRLSADGES